MKRIFLLCTFLLGTWGLMAGEKFPDGTPIDAWYRDVKPVDVAALGEKFVVTDYGVKQDSTLIQTEALQAVIDRAAAQGGVVVIPKGVFLSGSLFFILRSGGEGTRHQPRAGLAVRCACLGEQQKEKRQGSDHPFLQMDAHA